MPVYLTHAPLTEMKAEIEMTDFFLFAADPALAANSDEETGASSGDTADLTDIGSMFRNGYLFLLDPDLTGSGISQPVLEDVQDPLQMNAI